MERVKNLIRLYVEPSSSVVQRHIDKAEEVERRLYEIRETLAQKINSGPLFLAMRSMDAALDELIKVRCERIPRERNLFIGSFKIQLPPKYLH